jgi:hypothetical protein
MYLISLRGNILGVDEKKENKPYQIQEVIRMGFHCWVDVWWHNDQFYLGTNEPYYPIKPSFLNIFALWCNAMNFDTLIKLKEQRAPHYFQWQGDPLLTNTEHIITDIPLEIEIDNTILITDEYQYSEIGLKGIISENIASFQIG